MRCRVFRARAMRFFRQGLLGLFLLSLTLGILAYAGQTLRLAVEARMAREARVPERRATEEGPRRTRVGFAEALSAELPTTPDGQQMTRTTEILIELPWR